MKNATEKQEAIPMRSDSKIFKVSEGDVFSIPMNDRFAFIGQVLRIRGSRIFVVVFDHLVDRPTDIDEARNAMRHLPIVTSWTVDARFRPGMWTFVTNATADRRELLPAFTWGLPETGGVRVTSFDETKTRYATAEEAASIPRRITRSPMLIEDSLLMHAGIKRHDPALDEVRYIPVPSPAELFDK